MENKPVICVGAALVDQIFTGKGPIESGTSNPSTLFRSPGGVARNIASHLARLGHRLELISHIGTDSDGDWLYKKCVESEIGMSHVIRNEEPTGSFTAINQPNGELFVGASVSAIETELTCAQLESKSDILRNARLLILDCNLHTDSINWILSFAQENKVPCIIEPVSVSKAKKLSHANLSHTLMISPNEIELCAIADTDDLTVAIEKVHSRGLKYLWMRSGSKGSTIYSRTEKTHLAAPNTSVQDSTGCGDAALAGWVHGWLLGAKQEECLKYGHTLAGMAIATKGAELTQLNLNTLNEALKEI
ncbi:MAG: carbohydrate kinase family protein [Bacteroidota bacterium]